MRHNHATQAARQKNSHKIGVWVEVPIYQYMHVTKRDEMEKSLLHCTANAGGAGTQATSFAIGSWLRILQMLDSA